MHELHQSEWQSEQSGEQASGRASVATATAAATRTVHRTAAFALHHPTRHVRAILEHVFRDYTTAYTALLHASAHYSVDELRGLATFALDERTGTPRMNARTLANRLYAQPGMARTLAGVAAPLPSRLRQSVREHVAQSLMSYVALADAQAADTRRGGAPSAPSRLHASMVERMRQSALNELGALADNLQRERALIAIVQQTLQSETVAIPFVGISPDYGFGLYYQPETHTFYARLDVVGSASRHARPITARGRYLDIKSGLTYVRQADAADCAGAESFGRSTRAVLVPLEMGRWHETRLRFTSVAFLPQRGTDTTHPAAAVPVAGKLVRRRVPQRGRRDGAGDAAVRYELHVTFEVPVPATDRRASGTEEARPLLAINRGIYQLASLVVTSPDARAVVAQQAASGVALRAVQEALERRRAQEQQRGVAPRARDRRQSRIAEHHVCALANEVVELARRHGAQVVMEDMTNFASGHAIRQVSAVPRTRQTARRAMLNRRQFERVREAIDQRLELVGLPAVRVVSAAYISQTCLACGHRAVENRDPERPRQFRCASCGWREDIDHVAACNVARKLLWLRQRAVEKRAGLAQEERTSWDDFAKTFAAAATL
jgi:hypothetical protein